MHKQSTTHVDPFRGFSRWQVLQHDFSGACPASQAPDSRRVSRAGRTGQSQAAENGRGLWPATWEPGAFRIDQIMRWIAYPSGQMDGPGRYYGLHPSQPGTAIELLKPTQKDAYAVSFNPSIRYPRKAAQRGQN